MPDATGRGRLTVYLGAAPGVGKTCAMLDAAQALRQGGVDVVVGVVETHGRRETAARLTGLEVLPPRPSTDGGVTVAEFDVAAALRRRPAVLLVDELAHTNAPGSRHRKRWQDVEELLDAGIDIITTLNVQHVDSLRDPVARLTGIEVRERVPDGFLTQADALELVDLPTDTLLERLQSGKVYAGDAAQRALNGFFTSANLAGLRELALRFVAGRVRAGQEAQGLAAHRQPAERLLVAVGPSPTSARLIRAAKRMVDATGGSWVAVHAETPATLHLAAQDRARIGEHLRLAESLGGQTLTIGGDDAARGLVEAARRQGARRIIVGKPTRTRWQDRWRRSLADELLRVSGDIEVLAIAGDGAAEGPAPTPRDGEPSTGALMAWTTAVGAVAIATAVALPLRQHLEPANLTLPFLLAVVGVALLGQRGPVVLTTILGVGLFDVLCVPPYGSLAVSDTEYVLTFVGMLVVGMTIAHLVARLRQQIDHALHEAEGAAALHRLGSGLATVRGLDHVVRTATTLTGDILGCRATVLVTDAPGSSSLSQEALLRLADETSTITAAELAVAHWVARNGQPAGVGTDTLAGATGLHLPLAITGGITGVLVLTGISAARSQDPAWRRLAEAAARLTALALGCERLSEQAATARVQADHAQLRATLLAGVSHDLQTPLTAISGLAQQLADDPDPERRRTAQTIAEQAERLATTVRNLLDLTRLGTGALRPRRVALEAEDAIATALASLRPRTDGRTIRIDARDCPALSADETLLHSALVNLLDNALVHTTGAIDIRAHGGSGTVTLTIADHGPGIPAAERERIFDTWQRGSAAGPGGAGLGLALVRAIAQAHGGTITTTDHAGGGAAFLLTMPAHAQP